MKFFDRFRLRRPAANIVLIFLLIEFLDEFIFGAREAAWPLIRDELNLTYFQIGVLLSLPNFISSLVEPLLGVYADLGRRRLLILSGGLTFSLALAMVALSSSFLPLLLAFVLFNPSSGAFVSLSQASLMDLEPTRREQNMARWTFAGSLGVVAGPLALTAALFMTLGWRSLFFGFALLSLLLLISAWRRPELQAGPGAEAPQGGSLQALLGGLRIAFQALRRREVLRWLVLLEFSDLMLDVLYGFLALYFVDVVATTPQQAGLAVAIWTGFGLLGDFLLIPLLERVPGLRYLRISAAIELLLYPLFLLAPQLWLKLTLLALTGFFNAGWYSILKARLYSSMPGKSGTSMAVDNIFGLFASFFPLGLGWIAGRYNLTLAMWLLLAGPLALLAGLPHLHSVPGEPAPGIEGSE